jgi:nucleoside 2-deoxyribosyltransferase
MKYFVSYANTDEDITEVAARMQKIVDALSSQNQEIYCDLFDEELLEAQTAEKKDFKKIMESDFKRLLNYDSILAILTSPRRSIGQLMELGAAYSQKIPIILLEHTSASGHYSYLPELASEHHVWQDDEELIRLIKEISAT